MSKKVDLNAPRNSSNDYKSHNNHSFYHGLSSKNYNSTTDNSDSSDPNAVNSGTNEKKQKLTEKGLKKAGLSKLGARMASNSSTEMDFDDKVKAVLKFVPPHVKIALVGIIIGLSFIGLMLFVALFSDAEATGVSDYISLAESCSRVTVTDTGCDINGDNCSHKYDGEVDFEDYIAGVVAGVGDGANSLEFYKALSIMMRTYFLANADSSCNVYGNSSFMEYKDITDAVNKDMIKKAVSDTSKIVLVNGDNDLVLSDYSMACVVDADDNFYYLRHGLIEADYQRVNISFDNSNQPYSGKLRSLFSLVDTNVEYENRSCPADNNSNAFSLIGALYLAKSEGYSYDNILEYYFGEINEVKAEGAFMGNVVDGFINPVSNFYSCTSSYGCRVHPISGDYRYHAGIDIPVVEGTPVYATKAGKIKAVRINVTGYESGSYGNYIEIDHLDGTMTRYAHLKYGGVMVSVGMMVNQGQAIGLSGNTGGSTGPHLHYEVHVNGKSTDPYYYLDTSVIGNANSCNYGQSVNASYCGR